MGFEFEFNWEIHRAAEGPACHFSHSPTIVGDRVLLRYHLRGNSNHNLFSFATTASALDSCRCGFEGFLSRKTSMGFSGLHESMVAYRTPIVIIMMGELMERSTRRWQDFFPSDHCRCSPSGKNPSLHDSSCSTPANAAELWN